MKKFLSIFVSMILATTMFAQTAAENICDSEFSGFQTINAGTFVRNKKIDNLKVTFNLNQEDNNRADFHYSTGNLSVMGYTIYICCPEPVAFEIEKKGSTYSIKNEPFKAGMSNQPDVEEHYAEITGNVTSSSIDIANKKATISIEYSDLPVEMQSIIKVIKSTFTLTLDELVPTGIDDVNTETQMVAKKMVKDGKLVIRNNNAEYNAAGQLLK